MHWENPQLIDSWLHEIEADDERLTALLSSTLSNKKVLDFGCGNGDYLNKSKTLATEVIGFELVKRVQEYWKGELKIISENENAG